MAIKPTKPTTPPKASRSDPATFPARAEGTVDFLFGDNLDYVDDSNTFVDDRADQALASAVAASAGNLDAAQRETFAGYLVGVSEDAGNPLEAVEIVEKPDLTQAQVEDDTSTVFGAVSGQRLNQSIEANLNVTGAAPMYACRAWVNFDGTGTVSIRASGNVSSITDNGIGDYTVNFASAMPDVNYCFTGTGTRESNAGVSIGPLSGDVRTTSAFQFRMSRNSSGSDIYQDQSFINVAFFR